MKYLTYLASNPYRLIIIMPLLFMIIHILIFYVFGGLASSDEISCLYDNMAERIIIMGIIGPAIETIIFHFLLMELLLFIFIKSTNRYLFVIIISSLIFAITHDLQIHSLISAFIGGILLSSSYIIAKVKNMIPVLVVFFIHALANCGVIFINQFVRL